MISGILKGNSFKRSLLAAVVLAAIAVTGCGGSGSDSYDQPVGTATKPLTGQTQNVLIDAATLQNWMSEGLVNKDSFDDKVVILDATDADSYAKGHILGAQLWDVAEQVMTRVEGPAPAVNMVLDGPSMDAMIQKHGITENTTIVITSSKADTYFPSRAYFLFRYWGFPKERIKVLNGYNGAWDASALTTVPTVVAESDYSVQDSGEFCPDERIALSELIEAVDKGVGMPVDFRGDKTAALSTPGVYADDQFPSKALAEGEKDYGVFEGLIEGGKFFVWKNFNVEYGVDNTFKDAKTIAEALIAAGIKGNETVYSYCRTGYIASTGYFVLDGILGWDVMTYDGSYSQWGKMSDDAAKGGDLPAGSLWETESLTVAPAYNLDAAGMAAKNIESLYLDAQALADYPDPIQSGANQVENEDEEYVSSGSDDAAPVALAPAASGGGC